MIILCKTFLPYNRAHPIPADLGRTIKQIPVLDKFTEVDVDPKITIESTDSNIVFRVL